MEKINKKIIIIIGIIILAIVAILGITIALHSKSNDVKIIDKIIDKIDTSNIELSDEVVGIIQNKTMQETLKQYIIKEIELYNNNEKNTVIEQTEMTKKLIKKIQLEKDIAKNQNNEDLQLIYLEILSISGTMLLEQPVTIIIGDDSYVKDMKLTNEQYEEYMSKVKQSIDKVLNKYCKLGKSEAKSNNTNDIYVALYNNGTLIFNNKNEFDESKLVKEYGKITYNYSESINSLWYNDRDIITNVESISKIYPINTAYWFNECEKLETINFENIDLSDTTDMNSMFTCCIGLKNLDLSNSNISKATNMNAIFCFCTHLKNINLDNINTSNVTDMSKMFGGCSKLESINLSSLNTSNVTDMSYMFYGCPMLESIDLSNFNTANVTNMNDMFSHCNKLRELDLSSFKTPRVTNMAWMFYDCSSLNNIKLNSFDTSNVTNMKYMFSKCKNLNNLNLNNFKTNKVEDMQCMFEDCSNLTSIDLSNFDTSKVKYMGNMFRDCIKLTELDLSSFSLDNANCYHMFENDLALKKVYVKSDYRWEYTKEDECFKNCGVSDVTVK